MHARATGIYTLSLHDALPIFAGSSRMKAGTATKLVLNMLSTTSMVKLGRTRDDLMVDLRPTNEKLRQRAIQMVEDRKSTRLNSSHTVISYAVFCLKKKNKQKK